MQEFNFLEVEEPSEGTATKITLNSLGIKTAGILPHDFPALGLIDGMVGFDREAKTATAVRFLRPEDPFFAGHFPGDPTCPGHILSEMANLAAAMLYYLLNGRPEIMPQIYMDNGKKIRNKAKPYDILFITCSNVDDRSRSFSCDAKITKFVAGKEQTVAEFSAITGMKRDSHLKKN